MADKQIYPFISATVNSIISRQTVYVSRPFLLEERTKKIRSIYSDKNQKLDSATNFDYSDKFNRDAYIIIYFPSHVNIAHWEMKWFWNSIYQQRLATLNMNDRCLNVCSIGGGPASDIFGLLLHLEKEKFVQEVNASVLDKWPWQSTIDELITEMNLRGKDIKQIKCEKFDFFECDAANNASIINADLVIMMKFVSAVCQDKDICKEKLEDIMGAMKPGAFVLFIDNSGGGYNKLFSEAARQVGLLQIGPELLKYKIGIDEGVKMSLDFISHPSIWLCKPQVRANVSACLWMKHEEFSAAA